MIKVIEYQFYDFKVRNIVLKILKFCEDVYGFEFNYNLYCKLIFYYRVNGFELIMVFIFD